MCDTYSPKEEGNLKEVAKAIAAGRCIAFLGTAMSHPNVPMAASLAKAILARLAADPNASPDGKDAASALLKQDEILLQEAGACYLLANPGGGRRVLHEIVEELLKAGDNASTPTRADEILARLPIPIVVSYNYDNLFEKSIDCIPKEDALSAKRFRLFRNDNELPAFKDGQNPFAFCSVIKPHGDFGLGSGSFVVTEADYAKMRAASPKLLNRIEDWMWSYTSLFLGYGLAESDFRRAWFDSRFAKDNTEHALGKGYAITYGSERRRNLDRLFAHSMDIVMIQRDLTKTLELLARYVAAELFSTESCRALELIRSLLLLEKNPVLSRTVLAIAVCALIASCNTAGRLSKCCIEAMCQDNTSPSEGLHFAEQCGLLTPVSIGSINYKMHARLCELGGILVGQDDTVRVEAQELAWRLNEHCKNDHRPVHEPRVRHAGV